MNLPRIRYLARTYEQARDDLSAAIPELREDGEGAARQSGPSASEDSLKGSEALLLYLKHKGFELPQDAP